MKLRKLSKIADIVIGRTPSRSNPAYWGAGHVWVSISDMKSKIISETKEQITTYAIEETKCRKIEKGFLIKSP